MVKVKQMLIVSLLLLASCKHVNTSRNPVFLFSPTNTSISIKQFAYIKKSIDTVQSNMIQLLQTKITENTDIDTQEEIVIGITNFIVNNFYKKGTISIYDRELGLYANNIDTDFYFSYFILQTKFNYTYKIIDTNLPLCKLSNQFLYKTLIERYNINEGKTSYLEFLYNINPDFQPKIYSIRQIELYEKDDFGYQEDCECISNDKIEAMSKCDSVYKYYGIASNSDEVLTQAIDKGFYDVETLFFRGFVRYNNDKYEEAISDLKQVIFIDPKHFLASHMLAEIYFRQKDFNNSLIFANRADSLKDSKNADIQFLLGEVQEKLGNVNISFENYDNAAKIDSIKYYNKIPKRKK